jgi:hypothetical protein
MAITYDDGIKRITVDGQAATPASLLVIEGVTRHGDASGGRYSYHIPFNIYLANGASFSCVGTFLVFSENWSAFGYRFDMSTDSTIIIESSAWLTPTRGFMAFNNATIIKSFFRSSRGITHRANCVVSNTIYYDCGSLYWFNKAGNSFTDCVSTNTAYGIIPQAAATTNLRNKITGCTRGILVGYNSVDQNIYNLQITECTKDIQFHPRQVNLKQTNLIDCLIDPSNYEIGAGTLGRKCQLNLKSIFTFLIEDGDGATAKIYDKDGNLHEEIEIEGATTKEVIYYTHYFEFASPANISIITVYEPLKILVEKEGYDTLEISDITITQGVSTVIRAALLPVTPPIYIDRRIQGSIAPKQITGTASVKRLTGVVRRSVSISGTVRPLISITGHITKQEIEGEVNT